MRKIARKTKLHIHIYITNYQQFRQTDEGIFF